MEPSKRRAEDECGDSSALCAKWMNQCDCTSIDQTVCCKFSDGDRCLVRGWPSFCRPPCSICFEKLPSITALARQPVSLSIAITSPDPVTSSRAKSSPFSDQIALLPLDGSPPLGPP